MSEIEYECIEDEGRLWIVATLDACEGRCELDVVDPGAYYGMSESWLMRNYDWERQATWIMKDALSALSDLELELEN